MTAQAFTGLNPCVHCGFCLQSCPTFLVTGDESDGPRGRIVLMQALSRGDIAPDDAALGMHLDRCLGCRACEPVCPSGVSYAPALEESRRLMAGIRQVHWAARMTAAVLGEPVLRAVLLWISRLVRPLSGWFAGRSRMGFMAGMLAATRPWVTGARRRSPAAPAGAASQPAAALFRGCIMDGLFAHVHAATERTLRVNGYRLVDAPGQGCCGALHAHAGLHDSAAALARANVAAFAPVADAHVIVNSAGCGAMLKEYSRLLADDPLADEASRFASRVADVSEALAAHGPRRGAALNVTVAYDPPCHLIHAQRISEEPLAVMGAVPGVKQVLHAEAALCCGSAGSYSLTERTLSRAILARKVEALRTVRPDVVATGNPGCAMQIGAGLRAAGSPIPVVHPVELLDRSYAAAGYYDGP